MIGRAVVSAITMTRLIHKFGNAISDQLPLLVVTRPTWKQTLRDVMTQEQYAVTERSASQGAQAGDLLFGQLAAVDRLTMLEGQNGMAAAPVCTRTRMCSGNCARSWVLPRAEANRPGVLLPAAEQPSCRSELFKMMTDIKLVDVAYCGSSPALADSFGVPVQVIFCQHANGS
jgi:hypothetical protein